MLEIDTERLEQPTRAVTATHATAVSVDGSELVLVFGQRPLAQRYHQALVVEMARREVDSAIHVSNPTFVDQCIEAVRGFGYEPSVQPFDPDNLPEGRVVYERAAIMSLTYTDREADIRFWRVVPNQMRSVSPKKIGETLTPIVTVFLPTSRLADLLLTMQAQLGDNDE